MNDKDATSSYVELSSEAYASIVDAYASTGQRMLEYWKSFWEIASRPYGTNAVEATVRENFDRANQIVSLTIGEMQTSGQLAAELAEKLFAQGAKAQESYIQSIRGLVDTGVSNMNFVKDTTSQQFGDLAKRLDEMQSRNAAALSSN